MWVIYPIRWPKSFRLSAVSRARSPSVFPSEHMLFISVSNLISNRIIFTIIKHKYRFFITTTINVELVFHFCTVVFVNYYLIYRFPRFNHTLYGPYSLESVLFFLVYSFAIFNHNFSVYVRIYLLVINLQRNSYETIWNFSWTDFAYMIRGRGG